MGTVFKRLETFKRYAKDHVINRYRLAEAGFIHSGGDDKVTCFWCNGTMEQWNRGDDPWTAHAQ